LHAKLTNITLRLYAYHKISLFMQVQINARSRQQAIFLLVAASTSSWHMKSLQRALVLGSNQQT